MIISPASFMQIDSICLFQDNTALIRILMSGSRGKFFGVYLNIISSVLVSFRVYYFVTTVTEVLVHG